MHLAACVSLLGGAEPRAYTKALGALSWQMARHNKVLTVFENCKLGVGGEERNRKTERKKIPICMIIRLGIGFTRLVSASLFWRTAESSQAGGTAGLVSSEDTPGKGGGSSCAVA